MGEEVLIHEGPSVSVPGLKVAGPAGRGEPPEIVFIKQFFTDKKTAQRNQTQFDANKVRKISAARACELVMDSMKADYGHNNPSIVKFELLPSPDPEKFPRPIEYYLITIDVTGSEEHRVVLLDGTVLEPRLKPAGK